MNYFSHPTAVVDSTDIGKDTRIWAFVHISKEVRIGENCNICDHCYIEDGVVIGNNVTVKSGIYLWQGVIIEDNVFLGPNVVFTNDIRPRSKIYKEPVITRIKNGASIGANSTLLAGITVGEYAMTGIGSVITRDIAPFSLHYGNPAKFRGWIDELGNKLIRRSDEIWESIDGKRFLLQNNLLSPIP